MSNKLLFRVVSLMAVHMGLMNEQLAKIDPRESMTFNTQKPNSGGVWALRLTLSFCNVNLTLIKNSSAA